LLKEVILRRKPILKKIN